MDTLEKPAKTPATAAEVRAWARKRGLTVGQRGHLDTDVVKAFNRFHHKRVFVSSNPWGKRDAS